MTQSFLASLLKRGNGPILRVPQADGTAGQFVTTDGSGNLSFASAAPAGSGTELQYRNGSSFGAVSGTDWNGTTLTVPKLVSAASLAVISASVNDINTRYFYLGNSVVGGFFGIEGIVAGTTFTNTSAYSLICGTRENKNAHFATNSTVRLTISDTGLIGINKASSIGAQLHVVSSSSTTVGAIVEGAALQSADLLQWNPSGVTAGTRARINASGEFVNDLGTTQSAVFGGANSIAASQIQAVAVGYNATIGRSNQVVIGCNATGYTDCFGGVAIGSGSQCRGANYGIAIGAGANTFGNNAAICIGLSATGSFGVGYGIALGAGAVFTAANQMVVGSSNYPITSLYVGKGVTSAEPSTVTIAATGGSGTDIVGGNLIVSPGRSTGSATPAVVKLQGTAAGASGTTAQTLADVVVITNSTTVDVSSGVTVQGGISKPTSIVQAEVTATPSGTTQTIDWTTGNLQTLNLGSASGNVTLTFTAPAASAILSLLLIQGATARDITWPGTVVWDSLGAPTWTGDTNKKRWITFRYNGTNYYASVSEQYT